MNESFLASETTSRSRRRRQQGDQSPEVVGGARLRSVLGVRSRQGVSRDLLLFALAGVVRATEQPGARSTSPYRPGT